MNTLSPSRAGAVTREAEQHAHAAARRHQGWLVPLGRAGWAAKGAVYLMVGWLAAQAALGTGGETTDPEGALLHILQAPSGSILLGLVALGLVGYAVWCALAAALDVEHKGTDAQGVVHRTSYGVTAVIYAGLALSALGLLTGTQGPTSGDQMAQDRTAWLLSQPLGRWLVGAVGLALLGGAVAQLIHAARGSFADAIPAEHQAAMRALGRAGYAAHGIALALIGIFLVVAAAQSRPDQARGLGGALAALLEQPFGPYLLAALAIGLAAYGAFTLVEARYRRMVIS